jgi:iron complex transport system substrate-binding protein
MKCRLAAVVSALTLAGSMAACAGGSGAPGSTATTDPAAGFPATVGSLTLDKRPERIVSLSATATEMLYAAGAGRQVVAVDENSTFPANAPKTDLSAYKPNAEAIVKHQPDLVILSDDREDIVAQLKTLRVPTLLAPAAVTLDDTYQQINDIGTITGHRDEAKALAEQIKADIDKLAKDVPKRTPALTFYYELDQNFYSIGSKTFIGSLFTMVGLVNIADARTTADNQYPQLAAEVIVKANPDLIFLADTKCCGQSSQTVAARPGWSSIDAVRDRGVVALDDDVASRWGPRVVDLLRAITDAVAKAPAG